MRKTIKRAALTALILAVPAIAMATGGLSGDCYDCHTMHNSENGAPVVASGPIPNLLRYDCLACHAASASGPAVITLSGSSAIPQVLHGQGMNGLAGGNFGATGSLVSENAHNVVDLFDGLWENNAGDSQNDTAEFGAPPGNAPAAHYHGYSRSVFTTALATPFDAFTCAGARGCHGTRSQLLRGDTADNTTDNVFGGERRTGMAALSGAHHANVDGVKMSDGYGVDGLQDETLQIHDGDTVAAGYRFIPGLYGYGNETTRWTNVQDADHNEYYGNDTGMGTGCAACHVQGHISGYSSRANVASTLRVPNNSMSGFCATCHGMFHSAGDGGDTYTYNTTTSETVAVEADYTDNGVSGAFLRHPSDYVIPARDEYALYTAYDISAPVARADINVTGSSNTVTAGDDMVMCLSCHYAHGSDQPYILRFDYATMTAGTYADQATSQALGGCLACHSLKGVTK